MTEDRLAGPARSGERKLVTLLFADLSGYTALVASMDRRRPMPSSGRA
jgi:class 3 adenylate cyclase